MFELPFMRLALAASMATGLSLGILGVYLAIRRVIFLGLVLANTATLGAAVAQAMDWPPEAIAFAAAVSAAAVLGDIDTSRRLSAESIMGWAYAAASSTTVLVLSWAAAGSSDTLHLLFGNVLAVQSSHVFLLVALAVAVVLAQLLLMPRFLLVTFDPEAARIAGVKTRMWSLGLNLSIGTVASAAVHEIGALSTFALLALPSTAALLATTSVRLTFLAAGALGALVPALALVLSFQFDLPAGPTCVALLALSVPLAAAIAAARGRL